jgi:hypothetical protein
MPSMAMQKFSDRYGCMLLCGRPPPAGTIDLGDIGAAAAALLE